MYAQWKANTHTVSYNANGGSVSGTSKMVTYDSSYGTLPTPTRKGYTFTGWYLNSTEVKNTTIVKTDETHTLVAGWKVNTYTVIYNSNGGSGSMSPTECTYDVLTNLRSNSFSRNGWTFDGWNTKSDGSGTSYSDGQSVLNWLESGSITLYAMWVKTEVSADFSGRTIELGEGATHDDWINTGMSKEALIRNGYTTIEVVITFDTKRNNLIVFNKMQLSVVSNGKATGANFALSLISQSWTTFRETYTINVSDLNDDGSFTVHWAHLEGGGNGETWYIGTTTVTATAKK